MEHQKIAPPELKNKQRLWITKEKVSYGQKLNSTLCPTKQETMLYHLSWEPILFFVEYMFVPLYATIGFKQGKRKSKICKRILKDCQDAGYYMQLCSLFVCFLCLWNNQGHASGRNPLPPELIDSPAKGKKNLTTRKKHEMRGCPIFALHLRCQRRLEG